MLRAEAALGPVSPRPEVSMQDLWDRAVESGNPVPPLVDILPEGAHRGATSQDILDTATMLVAKESVADIVVDVHGAMAAAAGLAREYGDLPAAGRTLLQHAVPITFGLRAAGWLVGLGQARDGLQALRFPAQLGGAAGTLAVLGEDGPAALARFARELDLDEPVMAWHTLRAPIGALAGALGVTA